jgi:ABC-type Co2+ transport system permease subunit
MEHFSMPLFVAVLAGGIAGMVLIEACFWWNRYTKAKKIKDAERSLVLGAFFVACFFVLTPLSWQSPTPIIALLGGAWFYSLLMLFFRPEEFLAALLEDAEEE